MNPKDIRNAIAAQCGFTPNKAKSADIQSEERRFLDCELREARTEKLYQERGYHPDNKAKQGEPTSFSAWLEANGDSIEPLDRTEATAQWFDNKEKDLWE